MRAPALNSVHARPLINLRPLALASILCTPATNFLRIFPLIHSDPCIRIHSATTNPSTVPSSAPAAAAPVLRARAQSLAIVTLPVLHRVGVEGDEQLLMRRKSAKREAITKVSIHPLDPQPPSHFLPLLRQRSLYLLDATPAIRLAHSPPHLLDLFDLLIATPALPSIRARTHARPTGATHPPLVGSTCTRALACIPHPPACAPWTLRSSPRPCKHVHSASKNPSTDPALGAVPLRAPAPATLALCARPQNISKYHASRA